MRGNQHERGCFSQFNRSKSLFRVISNQEKVSIIEVEVLTQRMSKNLHNRNLLNGEPSIRELSNKRSCGDFLLNILNDDPSNNSLNQSVLALNELLAPSEHSPQK